jgi:hypothetical protein
MLTVRRLTTALVLAALQASACAAEITPAAQHDVEGVLARLGASNCKFNRNGTWYNATEARSHLERKYQYALDKKLLGSAEDFIRIIGSKSSMSNQAYIVQCGTEQAQPSAAWLGAQLNDIRSHAAGAAKPAR